MSGSFLSPSLFDYNRQERLFGMVPKSLHQKKRVLSLKFVDKFRFIGDSPGNAIFSPKSGDASSDSNKVEGSDLSYRNKFYVSSFTDGFKLDPGIFIIPLIS